MHHRLKPTIKITRTYSMIPLEFGLKGMYEIYSCVSRSINNARGKASASHYLSIDGCSRIKLVEAPAHNLA
ncbi:hypothetical protein VN97_g3739 [Penicillium thymicola]|uniref:Uncharacterized protein n=1 Tax=Penicillium thymicola TaxID=293382 RepID=A0AAI9XA55_PENTH|nr:hypothetical protein VN97_g3739 [Penicillium thymicola]